MEDSYAKKKLPYNLNAEKSVIGSMLMDRDAIVYQCDSEYHGCGAYICKCQALCRDRGR